MARGAILAVDDAADLGVAEQRVVGLLQEADVGNQLLDGRARQDRTPTGHPLAELGVPLAGLDGLEQL